MILSTKQHLSLSLVTFRHFCQDARRKLIHGRVGLWRAGQSIGGIGAYRKTGGSRGCWKVTPVRVLDSPNPILIAPSFASDHPFARSHVNMYTGRFPVLRKAFCIWK